MWFNVVVTSLNKNAENNEKKTKNGRTTDFTNSDFKNAESADYDGTYSDFKNYD